MAEFSLVFWIVNDFLWYTCSWEPSLSVLREKPLSTHYVVRHFHAFLITTITSIMNTLLACVQDVFRNRFSSLTLSRSTLSGFSTSWSGFPLLLHQTHISAVWTGACAAFKPVKHSQKFGQLTHAPQRSQTSSLEQSSSKKKNKSHLTQRAVTRTSWSRSRIRSTENLNPLKTRGCLQTRLAPEITFQTEHLLQV